MTSTSGNKAIEPGVAALAGRRIDALDAVEPHFPVENVMPVRKQITDILTLEGVRVLVSSAACGADLVGLDAAMELGVRCLIVLPFDVASFRTTSVTDRPGDWGPLFDRVIEIAAMTGNLIILDGVVGDEKAYDRANEVIILEAANLARPSSAIAIVVWEGRSRGSSDATEAFRQLAFKAGMKERMVLTYAG